MSPPKVDSSGTHIYTPSSHLSLTCIHMVGSDSDNLIDFDHDKKMKEEIENLGKHQDDYVIINDDAEENGLEDDEDFYGFHNNEDVTSEAGEAYMDTLNNIKVIGKDIYQFLMGEYWYQDLDNDGKDYTSSLMELISSSS